MSIISARPLWAFEERIGRHWGLHLFMGIAAIVLGIIGLGFTGLATLAGVLYFGWLLFIGGVLRLGHAFYTRHWQGVLLNVLAGLLWLFVGGLIIARPTMAAAPLTFVLGLMFFVSGIFKLVVASMLRYPQWGWTIVDGCISILLAILILDQWPSSAFWVIGLFISIDLIFEGWAMVAMALASHRIEQDVDELRGRPVAG
jgi:uncharacterized membrane protein HdeD (DUF308 family)